MAPQGFQNLTPFAAEELLLLDEEGAQVITLVAKATYAIKDQSLELVADQAPVLMAPVHHGEPSASSLKYESEAPYTKPATDVVLLGHAQPEEATATELDVVLKVGPIHKQVRVFGDRVWEGRQGALAPGAPRPFERIPLVYERAFGGWDRRSPDPTEHRAEARNPVGVGYKRPGAEPAARGEPLPNLEDPADLIRSPDSRPAPAGFGYLRPDWAPRREFAGTFDEGWSKARFPRLPVDFDRRHFNAAPEGQQVPGFLSGGERVEVRGASRRGALRFALPRVSPEGSYQLARGREERLPMHLDTVIIDADAHRVSLLWRGSSKIHRRLFDLAWSRLELGGNEARVGAHGARR